MNRGIIMENKYSNYFMIIGIIYLVSIIVSLLIIPAEFYTLDNAIFLLIMILPIPVFFMYFFEKPDIEQIIYLKYLFPILSAIAIIISFMLIWMFF
ncbi:MAG: hypothetical protein HZB65_01370 [Candidatus Aenigmarchaeota archaeon]|nr:hypothetical protein [Candidatus Aenigmarchaeota archaeon]